MLVLWVDKAFSIPDYQQPLVSSFTREKVNTVDLVVATIHQGKVTRSLFTGVE